MKHFRIPMLFLLMAFYLQFCIGLMAGEMQVVVYTSVDQPFAEPIFAEFTRQTGIRVKPVFDTEAAKTVGLANRLRAEKSAPRADVFWSSEFAHTIRLAREDMFESYAPASATDLAPMYRGPDNLWTCAGLRARVMIVSDRLSDDRLPSDTAKLLDSSWKPGEVTFARPLFGTTNTQAAAMYAAGGEEKLRAYFAQLKKNGVAFVDGNATTRDRVVAGTSLVGMTDTDDAVVAIKRGAAVKMVFPGEGDDLALVIPNTAALIKNGPNPETGRRFIDFITSAEGEKQLVKLADGFYPIREGLDVEIDWLPEAGVAEQKVSFEQIADSLASATQVMRELFLD